MFLDRDQFAFVRELEAGWTAVRDECLGLSPNAFEPWVQREMYGEGWNVYGLVAFGRRIEPALTSRSSETRVVLLLDVLRPGFTDASDDVPPPEVEAAIQRSIRSK